MRKLSNGGGWMAIGYSIRKAREAGGFWKFYKALRTKNTCKTCALGMGGQRGGMVNEQGAFPEVCKKSMQAMASDMQAAITADFWQQHSIEELQSWSPRRLEKSGRLIQPVLFERGQKNFRPVTWKESLQRIVDCLKSIHPDQSFWYFSGRSSNEAGFLLQLAARVYGTNNVNNCSYYCHQASGVGLSKSLGTGTATVTLDDVDHCDVIFVIGGNPASNHPRLMTTLTHVRRRGGKVVVINPVRELGMRQFRIPSDPRSMLFGAQIASHYCQPHIGGDLALLTGIAKGVCELGAVDEEFLTQYVRGGKEAIAHLTTLQWSQLEYKSGVPAQEMKDLAKVYSASKNTIFSWTMGITHHTHGVENVEAIVNLALLRGMVGRPGAGLMPIRGHSNVQGIGSVGVTPQLKEAIFDRLKNQFGLNLPTTPGMDTLACIEAAHCGKSLAAICLGGNLYGSNPDAAFAKEALGKLKLLATLSTTLNTGHVHALADQTLILPVLPRDEEPHPTTQESMFNFVRLSDGGPARYPGPRSEIQVIADLGKRLIGDSGSIRWDDLSHTDTIRHWISQVVPGYQKVADISRTKKEFHIEGRTFHHPHFPTPDGKAVMSRHEIPDLIALSAHQLRLMTIRSEGQFNTVVYEEEDLYRGQNRRDIILIHPEDLMRMGIENDQPVTITSQTGRIDGYLARAYSDVRPGNALMYYPEANILVPRTIDPQSKTPAFKAILVDIRASVT
jgi:molybdopterin-dependent oxidoreductase alpha subunit